MYTYMHYGMMWFCFDACLPSKQYRKEHKENFSECLNLISKRSERFCSKCISSGKNGNIPCKIYWKLCTFMSYGHEMNVVRAYVLCYEHADTSFTLVENAMNLGMIDVLDKIYEHCSYPCMLEF